MGGFVFNLEILDGAVFVEEGDEEGVAPGVIRIES
jgi:hypothetical protein